MSLFIFTVILIISTTHGQYVLPSTINIGYLYEPSRDGHNLSGLAVMSLAEDDLHRNQVIPETTTFKYFYLKITCDPYDGPIAFIDLYQKHNISALMGPPCAEPADVIGRLAVPWNILLMSHGSNAEEFLGKHVYKTFARTSLFSPSQVARATALFVRHNGWRRVAVVERFGLESTEFLTRAMKAMLLELGVEVTLHIQIMENDDRFDEHLKKIREQARVIIPIFSRSTSGSAEFLLRAHEAGMTGPDYAYVFAEEEADRIVEDHWDSERLNASATYRLRMAYQAVMVVKLLALGKGRAVTFKKNIERKYAEMFPDRPSTDYEYKIYQPPLYDSISTYGMALNLSVAKQIEYDDGTGLFNLLRWQQFPGAVAPVIFDERVERAPTYVVESFDFFGNWTKLMDIERARSNDSGRYDFETASGDTSSRMGFVLIPTRPNNWRRKGNKPPLDTPVCGFDGRLCTAGYGAWYTTIAVVACITVVAGSVAVYFIRKRSNEQNVMTQTFLIDLEKLRKLSHTGASDSLGGTSTITSGSGSQTNMSLFSRFSVGKFKFASYDGTPTHVECYKKIKHCVLDRTQLKKLNGFRHVMHENTTAFLGISNDGPDNLVILWQFVSNRSLRDVLHNSDIKLDDDFLSTFMKGVTNGLKYLHRSPLDHHGCLTTQTCLVDSRMICKLTGYGLTTTLSHMVNNGFVTVEKKFYDKYHLAPECLMKLNSGLYCGSKQADMFSLAMVIYQIVTRRELFEDFILTPEEILEKVCAPTTSLMRPEIPISVVTNWGDPVKRVIAQCWDHDPSSRLDIDAVSSVINSACKKFSGSIMEKMMDRMERYAANLEKVVVERTNEAREQQKRAEALLMELLPKSVAERLQQGMTIEPEVFAESTIMFTDIVGFTSLSSGCTAMEVILLLNQLYSGFDSRIEKRDVYKVETIGDAYMVVSGVPLPNKNHVDEILMLALSIRDFVAEYTLPFGDHGHIRIRLGAHSGPVVSGVVGSKMPRFCLFGDSVRMAAKMESTGVPMKIQVSKAVKKFVKASGINRYTLHRREDLPVQVQLSHKKCMKVMLSNPFKGKVHATQTTYFVESTEDDAPELPVESIPVPNVAYKPTVKQSPAPKLISVKPATLLPLAKTPATLSPLAKTPATLSPVTKTPATPSPLAKTPVKPSTPTKTNSVNSANI